MSPRRASTLRALTSSCGVRHIRKWGGKPLVACAPGLRRNFQYGREEKFVGAMGITSKERWAELAQHVHSLCMSIGVDDEVVEVIASLRNLRSLELVGLPLEKSHPATAREVNLPYLQNLKLRGYFSAAVARNICHNAEHVTHLNIGLLATPTDDAAYEDTLLKNNDNRSLVTEEEAEEYRRNGCRGKGPLTQSRGGRDRVSSYRRRRK